MRLVTFVCVMLLVSALIPTAAIAKKKKEKIPAWAVEILTNSIEKERLIRDIGKDIQIPLGSIYQAQILLVLLAKPPKFMDRDERSVFEIQIITDAVFLHLRDRLSSKEAMIQIMRDANHLFRLAKCPEGNYGNWPYGFFLMAERVASLYAGGKILKSLDGEMICPLGPKDVLYDDIKDD